MRSKQTISIEQSIMDDVVRAEQEILALKDQRTELIATLGALTHYAECQVLAFSSGRPHLDMTLFPSLCASARAVLAKHKGAEHG